LSSNQGTTGESGIVCHGGGHFWSAKIPLNRVKFPLTMQLRHSQDVISKIAIMWNG